MSSSASAPKPAVKGFSKKDLTHFEKRLLEERKRVLKELGHHTNRFGAEGDSVGCDQRSTCVETNVWITGYQRVGRKAFVLRRVGHKKNPLLLDGVRAEGLFQRRLGSGDPDR